MKVTLRFLLGSLVCCSLVATTTADDRYRTGSPTPAPARSSVQLKQSATVNAFSAGPAFRTAADPRPASTTSTRTELAPRADLAPHHDLPPRVEPTPTAAEAAPRETHVPLSLSSLNPTPEMWFYEQLRQDYNNPELQVRRNSEQAAAQRRARLASSAWFGVHNSRPMAYTTPHMYHYSPTWATNSRFPYLWGAAPSTQIYIEGRRTYAGVGTW